MLPLLGEGMDATELATATTGFQRFFAGASLTLSALTGGLSPNVARLTRWAGDIGARARSILRGAPASFPSAALDVSFAARRAPPQSALTSLEWELADGPLPAGVRMADGANAADPVFARELAPPRSEAPVLAEPRRSRPSLQVDAPQQPLALLPAASDMGPRRTMVIGRRGDVANYHGGGTILDLPKVDWNLLRNDAWIQSGTDANVTFRLATPKLDFQNLTRRVQQLDGTFLHESSVFLRELKMLRNAGYRRVGDLMIPASQVP